MASTLGWIRRIFFLIFHTNEIFIACGFGAAQQTFKNAGAQWVAQPPVSGLLSPKPLQKKAERLLLARLRQVPGAVHHLHHGNEEPALATTVNAKHCHVVFELRGITKQCAQRACTYRRPSSARAITSPSDNQCVCSRSWSRHLNASATASSAWIAVVSNNGTLVCSCCTSMTISVQPSITPSAPAAPSCSMIRRYSVLELERTSP